MSDLAVGSTFAGRYRIEAQIAAGGMGAVYEVTHIETNRRRALKVMHPDFTQSSEARERFRQEARIAAEIQSEYIVDVFDAGIDDETQMPFLVMELLRGKVISKVLRRMGRMEPEQALVYLHQTAQALDKTHRARIVHRDLKPENLFLCERDEGPPRIKVLDFGIAKIVAENSMSVNATRAVGTPLYMAPEQFSDMVISPATDLYALAMIAYKMIVGRAYFSSEAKESPNVFLFARNVVRGPEEPATVRAAKRGVTLPPAFDAWFAKATAKSQNDRFESASASIYALAEVFGIPAANLANAAYIPALLTQTGEHARMSLTNEGGAIGANASGRWSLSGEAPFSIGTDPGVARAPMPSELPFGTDTASAPGRTVLAGEMTDGEVPWKKKRPALWVGGSAVAACLVLLGAYAAFSGDDPDPAMATQPSEGATSLAQTATPEVIPSTSADVPVVVPATTSTLSDAPTATAATATAPATTTAPPVHKPATTVHKTTAPRPTTTTTKGRWIRD